MTPWRLRAAVAGVLACGVLATGMAGTASALVTQLELVTKFSPIDSSSKSVTVTCPEGKRVLGGGADISPNSASAGVLHVLIDMIRPGATLRSVTTRAREDEVGTSEDWFLMASAVCAPAPAGLERVAATSEISSARKAVVAGCPAGKRLVGTGGETSGATGQVNLDGLLPNSALTRSTVNAVEDDTGTGSSWTVTAYAVCSEPIAGLERVAATSASDSAGAKYQFLDCPAGKAAVGGGGTINAPDGEVVFDTLAPTGNPPTGGLVGGWEDGSGNAADWTITAFAICAAQAHRLSLDTGRQSDQDTIFVEAKCPAGERYTTIGGELSGALGQAWLTTFGPAVFDETFAHVEAWEDSDGTLDPWGLSLHLICATAVPEAQIVTASSGKDGTTPKAVTATCPPGTSVLGGGGSFFGSTGLHLDGIVPAASLTSITARARDAAGSALPVSWGVTAHAICAPPPPGLERVAKSSARASEEVASATAICPAGKHLIGTGGEIVDGLGSVAFDDLRPDASLTRTTVTGTEDQVGLSTDWRARAYSICIDR